MCHIFFNKISKYFCGLMICTIVLAGVGSFQELDSGFLCTDVSSEITGGLDANGTRTVICEESIDVAEQELCNVDSLSGLRLIRNVNSGNKNGKVKYYRFVDKMNCSKYIQTDGSEEYLFELLPMGEQFCSNVTIRYYIQNVDGKKGIIFTI